MSEVTLIPVDPTPNEVQYREDRVYEFNSSATGITDGELLAFFVRDDDRIVAGICGNTGGGQSRFSFQTPAFYEKHGFEAVATILRTLSRTFPERRLS
jgi:hypothetical protein